MLQVMTLFLALILVAGPARALDLAGTWWATAAAEQRLDPLLLHSVALTESAKADGKLMAPHPWTLNIAGRAVFAESRAEAQRLLLEHAHSRRGVDVGPMQVNSRHHGHRVASLAQLLDTRTNLALGARILREALDTVPHDLELAIGRYHSPNPERGRAYARTVLHIYRQLQELIRG